VQVTAITGQPRYEHDNNAIHGKTLQKDRTPRRSEWRSSSVRWLCTRGLRNRGPRTAVLLHGSDGGWKMIHDTVWRPAQLRCALCSSMSAESHTRNTIATFILLQAVNLCPYDPIRDQTDLPRSAMKA